MNQISLFETRLGKSGVGAKTNTFEEISNENDYEEVLIRNTYLNGLEKKLPSRPYTSDAKSDKKKKIFWADKNDFNRKDLLCNINPDKELFFKRDIKPITNHKKMTPAKSSLKFRPSSTHAHKNHSNEKPLDLHILLNPNISNNSNANFVAIKNNPNVLELSNNKNNGLHENQNYNKSAKMNTDQNAMNSNNYVNNRSMNSASKRNLIFIFLYY